jgi:hypothetical protein
MLVQPVCNHLDLGRGQLPTMVPTLMDEQPMRNTHLFELVADEFGLLHRDQPVDVTV